MYPGASTRTTPEDPVEIRISGSPRAVKEFMERGSVGKEVCEVMIEREELTKTVETGGQEKEERQE